MPTKLPNLAYGRCRGPYMQGPLYRPNCCKCPLIFEQKIWPDGPVPARIAFVGEAPHKTELIQGRGFVGPSGQLLWRMAADVGISRDDVFVTNAILCKPEAIQLSNKAVIPKEQVQAMAIECCRERLLNELLMVDPVVIVPLGNWALRSLTDIPKAKVTAYRGSRIDSDLMALLQKVQAEFLNGQYLWH